MTADLKLGLQLGYWASRPPEYDWVGLARQAEDLGYDSVWTAESWGSDVFTPLAYLAAQHQPHPAGHRHRADGRAHAHRHGDARHHPGPPVRRPRDPGAGAERAAGRRGLVRPAVPEAAGAHARVRRGDPQGAAPRDGDQRRRVLPAAVSGPGLDGPGQAAAHQPAPAAQGPADLPRRRGPEERRPDRRDRRRLAPAVLRRRNGPRSTPTRSPGPRTASRSPRWCTWPSPARPRTTSSRPCGRSRAPWPSTSAAWAPRARTSTRT